MHPGLRSLPVLLSILLIGITSGSANSTDLSSEADVRHLTFPSEFGIGQLTLVPLIQGAGRTPREKQTTVGLAQGKVTVTVPADKALMLEIGRRVFDNPTLLNETSAAGIDCIKSSFFSMDENAEDIVKCDRIMKFIPRFKDLRFLDLDHSDTSDAGISNLKGMKKLQVLSLTMTAVTGSCFKDLRTLPSLTRVDANICPIKEENLAFLSTVPSLKSISLIQSRMTTSCMKLLSKCPSLETLSLRSNPKIDDTCISSLLALKHLKTLDLWDTAVTTEGILKLKGLPLVRLVLPRSKYSERNLALLKDAFPNAALIAFDHRKVNKEDRKIFAPTSDK